MSQINSEKTTVTKVNVQYLSLRIGQKTKARLDKLLDKVNANTAGKKVKPDQLIDAALRKIDAEDIRMLRDSVTSNLAYFDRAFDKQKAKNADISKDDFFALVLSGKIKIPELEKRLSPGT